MKPQQKLLAALIASTFILTGCGGSDGGSDSTDENQSKTIHLSGIASKGPIESATVNVYALNANGTKGTKLGTATTDATGKWSLNIIDYTGPIIAEASNGKYIDEANNTNIEMGDQSLRSVSVISKDNETMVITPFTHAITELVKSQANGTTIQAESAITNAIDSLTKTIDIDLVHTIPANPLAPTSSDLVTQKKYAALLGGISELANTIKTQNNDIKTAGTSVTAFELAEALARDMADGKLDGKDLTGAEVKVAAGSEQIAIGAQSNTDLSALETATTTFISTNTHITNKVEYAGVAAPEKLDSAFNTISAPQPGIPFTASEINGITLYDTDPCTNVHQTNTTIFDSTNANTTICTGTSSAASISATYSVTSSGMIKFTDGQGDSYIFRNQKLSSSKWELCNGDTEALALACSGEKYYVFTDKVEANSYAASLNGTTSVTSQ